MSQLRPYREHDPDMVAVALARLEGRAAALGIRTSDLTAEDVTEVVSDVARRFGYEWPGAFDAVARRVLPDFR